MFKIDLSYQSLKLSGLDHARQKEVIADIDRLIERALVDQARDRIINELQRKQAEHDTIARDLAGVVPEYLNREQAMKRLDVKKTIFKEYVAAGLIEPVDATAWQHQYFRHEVEVLRDIPFIERRRRVREWSEKR